MNINNLSNEELINYVINNSDDKLSVVLANRLNKKLEEEKLIVNLVEEIKDVMDSY